MNFLKHLVTLTLIICSLTAFATSEPKLLSIGDKLNLPKLTDQFEQPQLLLPETEWIIFSHDMDSSKIAKAALENQDKTSLSEANIQYYADISGMPGLISYFIAMPKMKKLPYTLILGREDEELAHLPKEEGKVLLIKLNNGNIEKFISTDDTNIIKNTIKVTT